jgi:AcrR family transcriptional regulator
MDEEGLDAVTMRRIGRELGVEAMSLYNHVEDKDDILQAICEEVLPEFRVPEATGWDEAARLGAREYRRLLLAHPNVITLMSARKGPITNVDSLRAYEFALGTFRASGLSEKDSVMAFHAFGGYILGYVMMELGPMVGGPSDDAHARAHEQMAQAIGTADLPFLREALPHLVECDVERQFEFGLDLLIEGIRARVSATR